MMSDDVEATLQNTNVLNRLAEKKVLYYVKYSYYCSTDPEGVLRLLFVKMIFWNEGLTEEHLELI